MLLSARLDQDMNAGSRGLKAGPAIHLVLILIVFIVFTIISLLTMTSQRRPRILITNDDGPPAPQSPYVLGLYRALLAAGWRKDEVAVCLPSSQKSWSGMQFSIHAPVGVWWYYPIEGNDNGTHQETQKSWSTESRRVETERGEIGEWVVVDGVSIRPHTYTASAVALALLTASACRVPQQPQTWVCTISLPSLLGLARIQASKTLSSLLIW